MLFGVIMIRYWRKHPGNGGSFGRSRGQEFFDRMKQRFDERQQHSNSKRRRWVDEPDEPEPPKKPKRPNQDEIDAILDKIRKSGYDSLTKEEKKKLFDQSQQN